MSLWDILQEQLHHNNPVVLTIVVNAEKGSPGKPGFKMLTAKEGRIHGSIGGGAIEAKAISQAQKMLRHRTPHHYMTIDLSREKTNAEMACGGSISLYFELYAPNIPIYIFGCGHVGSALAHFASALNYRIIGLDNRKEVVEQNATFNPKYQKKHNSSSQPGATPIDGQQYSFPFHTIQEFDYENRAGYEKLTIPDNARVVILTHRHTHDFVVLKNIYTHYPNLPYIGMIGSQEKVKNNVQALKNELPDADLHNLYAPIGINIGGDSAAEIAFGVVAEIQALRYKKNVTHMRIEH